MRFWSFNIGIEKLKGPYTRFPYILCINMEVEKIYAKLVEEIEGNAAYRRI